jgi:alcohol dehydrogenase
MFYDLLIAINDINKNEFIELNKILLDPACKYRNFATFIELELFSIPTLIELRKKLTSINNIASNVSISGSTHSYPELSQFTLYANSAILDPSLCLTMPKSVTAASGIDAIIHAMESLTSRSATPMTELLALTFNPAIYKG